jgi:competence protein ComEC
MKNKTIKTLVLTGAFIFIVLILITQLPFGEIKISFLDVGQGDAIYIRTPDDYQILIDGGPSMDILEELGPVMPLYSRNIDILILTHPHSDHVNGLVEILKRFSVGKVFLVGTPSKNSYYKKFLELIKTKNIPVFFVTAKDDMKIGSHLYMDIIWPHENETGRHYVNLNNASLSLRLLFQDQSIVLTGDAETEQEQEIMESGQNVKGGIFKAGHHGSRTASSDNFLDNVNPETVIIQCGKDNSFSHPHKESLMRFIKRGIEIRRNDLEGRVEFVYNLLSINFGTQFF